MTAPTGPLDKVRRDLDETDPVAAELERKQNECKESNN